MFLSLHTEKYECSKCEYLSLKKHAILVSKVTEEYSRLLFESTEYKKKNIILNKRYDKFIYEYMKENIKDYDRLLYEYIEEKRKDNLPYRLIVTDNVRFKNCFRNKT